jgi:hypothetical protein
MSSKWRVSDNWINKNPIYHYFESEQHSKEFYDSFIPINIRNNNFLYLIKNSYNPNLKEVNQSKFTRWMTMEKKIGEEWKLVYSNTLI